MPRPLAPDALYPAGHLEISQRFVTLRTGITVRVAERGPSDGVPVVMLPGWGTPLFMYRHAFELLPAGAIRAIGTELRGFGLSTKPRRRDAYRLDEYCDDLDALLDGLALPQASLLAQSMGGGLALHYALRRPERVRALALVNPTGLTSMPGVRALGLLPPEIPGALGAWAAPRWLIASILRVLAYGNPALVADRVVDEYWSPTQLPGFIFAAQAAVSEFDWTPLTDRDALRVTAPTLVILGSSDRLVRSSVRDAERLASASVHVLDGGHCVHEECPERAYGLIRNWLQAHGRR